MIQTRHTGKTCSWAIIFAHRLMAQPTVTYKIWFLSTKSPNLLKAQSTTTSSFLLRTSLIVEKLAKLITTPNSWVKVWTLENQKSQEGTAAKNALGLIRFRMIKRISLIHVKGKSSRSVLKQSARLSRSSSHSTKWINLETTPIIWLTKPTLSQGRWILRTYLIK
jgi:hypothetical protein